MRHYIFLEKASGSYSAHAVYSESQAAAEKRIRERFPWPPELRSRDLKLEDLVFEDSAAPGDEFYKKYDRACEKATKMNNRETSKPS